MATKTLKVPDISCEHCEHTIKGALSPLEGVRGVDVDIPGKSVQVTYDEAVIGIDRLKEVLEEEDYPVESVA